MDDHPETYYTKFGFSHLTGIGKLGFLLAFLIAAFLVWHFRVRAEWAGIELEGPVGAVLLYGPGLGKMAAAGLVAAYLAAIALPRKRYSRREFYCAACGEFIGYRIAVCDSCGSNKYTTSPELAARRAKQREHPMQ